MPRDKTRDARGPRTERVRHTLAGTPEDRQSLVNDAAQKALERCDEALRELSLSQYRDFESKLGGELTDFAVRESIQQLEKSGNWVWPKDVEQGSFDP